MSNLSIRGPSSRAWNIDITDKIFKINLTRPSEVTGSWFIKSSLESLMGVYRNARIEKFGSNLIFNSLMSDVGEEYILILTSNNFILINIRLSPNKCSLDTYHQYVESYILIFSAPKIGARSVSGALNSDGRTPNPEEFAYSIIDLVYQCVLSVKDIRKELAKHPKTTGGLTGVDAQLTLASWKSNSSWYHIVDSPTTHSINLSGLNIIPIKIEHRSAIDSNLFISAVVVVLNYLIKRIPRTPLGSLSSYLLNISKNRLSKLDIIVKIDDKTAWSILLSGSHAKYSQVLAENLIRLKNLLLTPELILPSIEGSMPYYLMPPELIFQSYAIAQVLISLGASPEAISSALTDLKKSAGFQFGKYTAWSDTDLHHLNGWRDLTSNPSGYKPDLIILNDLTGEILLIDAKFRHSDEYGKISSQSSIRDIQAYMQEYQLLKSIIISPFVEGDPYSETISGFSYSIRGIALPPNNTSQLHPNLNASLNDMWNSNP